MMNIKYLRFFLAALALTLCTTVTQAQEKRVKILENKLQERDKVIIELLKRVEALERRVGVQSTTDTADTAQAATPANEKEPAQNAKPAPGVVVVEEKDAERALERSLTRAGALLLPTGTLEIEPRLTYARQEESSPGLFTSDSQLFTSDIERNSNRLLANLALRLGLPWESQLEIGLPYQLRNIETVTNVGFTPTDRSSRSGHGPGDVRVGLAKTLLRERQWIPDLIGRITWNTDTGERADNGVSLGGGFDEVQASLTAIKRQDPIAFVGEISYEHAFKEGTVLPGRTVSANFGSFIALNPETSLRFLLTTAYQEATELSGVKVDGSDQAIASLVIGGSTLLAPGTLLNLSVGVGLTDDADDFSISMSLPIRLDKPLF